MMVNCMKQRTFSRAAYGKARIEDFGPEAASPRNEAPIIGGQIRHCTRFGHIDKAADGVIVGWVKDEDSEAPLVIDIRWKLCCTNRLLSDLPFPSSRTSMPLTSSAPPSSQPLSRARPPPQRPTCPADRPHRTEPRSRLQRLLSAPGTVAHRQARFARPRTRFAALRVASPWQPACAVTQLARCLAVDEGKVGDAPAPRHPSAWPSIVNTVHHYPSCIYM